MIPEVALVALPNKGYNILYINKRLMDLNVSVDLSLEGDNQVSNKPLNYHHLSRDRKFNSNIIATRLAGK